MTKGSRSYRLFLEFDQFSRQLLRQLLKLEYTVGVQFIVYTVIRTYKRNVFILAKPCLKNLLYFVSLNFVFGFIYENCFIEWPTLLCVYSMSYLCISPSPPRLTDDCAHTL